MIKGGVCLFVSTILTSFTLSLYILVSALSLFNTGYSFLDRVFSVVLVLGEAFLFVHGGGYALNVLKSTLGYKELEKRFFGKSSMLKAAVFITSFNEQPDVLEETIVSASNFDYAPKDIYLLDDSTSENLKVAAEELAKRYRIRNIHRSNRRGFKAGAVNDALNLVGAEYLLVLDADQRASPDFLRRSIELMEEDPKLAFVQVPQFYSNVEQSFVARAAASQQAVFFEYVSEGKSVSNAMFSCGTNCVFRVDCLRDVGGMDENTVTEDIATSFKLHEKGYNSLYYNRIYVTGEGPASLSAYFKQQMRWAIGSFTLAKQVFKRMLFNPRGLKVGQWWEYFLSCTWYLVGWAYFVLMLCPILFLLLEIRPLIPDPTLYLVAFLPYLLFNLIFFFTGMKKRGYSIKWIWLGQLLTFISFPIFMIAAISAMAGKKAAFGVTPKGKTPTAKIPLTKLWPQITLLALCLVSAIVGVLRVYVAFDYALLVNIAWVMYYCIQLAIGLLFFNRPGKESYGDYMIFKAFESESLP